MTDILTRFCLVGAAVLFAALAAILGGRMLARQLAAIRPYLAAFLVFTFVAMNYAQKSGTNAPLRGASVELGVENGECKVENGGVVAVGDSTILHSTLYTLHSISTNDSYSFSLPSNGVRYSNWWLRGAYEDVFRLDLGEMRFPCGTNLCDSLWVYTWGMAGARLGDASNRIVATGAPMSAVPQVSRFWNAPTTNGSHLLTWENFFLNRDTNTPVSAQLELMPSGDFIARSNLVERLYRRVNPDDWDDDGTPNEVDVNPLAYDGDGFGPHQELPEGANSNAYCWVDLVVPDANALVTFTGDGYSALPDPTFIARAGDTNRVILLIGKTYRVTSRMPIVCIGRSSGEIEVEQVSATELSICWPVTIEVESGELRMENVIGHSTLSTLTSQFSMSVWPDCLGGGFAWTNSCCSVSGVGWTFSYSCSGTCTCTGCGALGYYGYESYCLPACGGACGCTGQPADAAAGEETEPSGAGASVSFSKSSVIFEDRYENAPGVWIERQSTKTALRCVAYGGPNGGHVRFEISGEDKLGRVSGAALPLESDVGPDNKIDFTIVYNGRQASYSADDIVATSTFTENVVGATQEVTTATMTSVQVWFSTEALAPLNKRQARHKYGVCEIVQCLRQPYIPAFSWVPLNGGTMINDSRYRCPLDATTSPLVVRVGSDVEYTPSMRVVAPESIEIRNARPASKGFGPGHAGGIGMIMELYVLPMSVSFSEIAAEEVPCDIGIPSGYFAFPAMASVASHTTQNGAGTWCNVDSDNCMGVDRPGIYGELLPMTPNGTLTNDVSGGWLEGTLYWPMPFGWNTKGTTGNQAEHGRFATWAAHETWIHSDGTCGVRKFLRYDVSRDIGTNVWFNGKLRTTPCDPL